MGRRMSGQSILIVEDSDDDYETIERALSRGENLKNPLIRCDNGQDALDFLQRSGKFADRAEHPAPGIVLLDLNMPGIDGREVLSSMKSNDKLKHIPVIVMTTSSDERDIDDCYKMGANTYIVKPLDWRGFMEAMSRLKEYWIELAWLPRT